MSNSRSNRALTRRIALLLRDVLQHGGSIDIDGLGTLSPGGKHGFRFLAHSRPRVFIA